MPTLKGQTTVAHHNLRSILHAVQSARALSRRGVSSRTGLSTATVTRHVNELVAAGVLRSGAPAAAEQAGPGRPPEELVLEPRYGRVIGVDVGEHRIRVAVADFAGTVTARIDRSTCAREGREASLKQLSDAMTEALDGTPEVLAAVVGVPGMVDVRTGVVIDAPNLHGWRELDLQRVIRDRLGLSGAVRIENDVNLAAVGEAARGAARGSQDFVFVSIRRGIGAGVFVEGRLLRGHAGMAGEMGFMASESSFDYRAANGLGHLETAAGEQRLLERATAIAPELWSARVDEATMRDLCLAVREGHQAATAIMDEALQRYGVAVANIVGLLDPELVVIGGDIAVIGEIAVGRIGEVVDRLVPHAPVLRHSALGEEATLHGALHQAHMHACDTLPGVLIAAGEG